MPQDTNEEPKYYAVSVGRKCGIYDNWETAKRQVNGYSGNRYQEYRTERGAINYMKRKDLKNHSYSIVITRLILNRLPFLLVGSPPQLPQVPQAIQWLPRKLALDQVY